MLLQKPVYQEGEKFTFHEKPIGTSKRGNSVFLCTPTSTLDGPKYSISTGEQMLFLEEIILDDKRPSRKDDLNYNITTLHKKWGSSFFKNVIIFR